MGTVSRTTPLRTDFKALKLKLKAESGKFKAETLRLMRSEFLQKASKNEKSG